jgi:hypothetical protein
MPKFSTKRKQLLSGDLGPACVVITCQISRCSNSCSGVPNSRVTGECSREHSIRLHFPVLVEITNFSCVVFQFTSNEFDFSVGSLAPSIVAVWILVTVMYVADCRPDARPDAPTHEEIPISLFPMLAVSCKLRPAA